MHIPFYFVFISMLSCCALATIFPFFHWNLNGVICRWHKIGSQMLIHSVCYIFWLGNLTHVHLKQSLIRMDSLPFVSCLSCLFLTVLFPPLFLIVFLCSLLTFCRDILYFVIIFSCISDEFSCCGSHGVWLHKT